MVDKSGGRMLFIQGKRRFLPQGDRYDPREERDEETIDDFLDSYCAGASRSAFTEGIMDALEQGGESGMSGIFPERCTNPTTPSGCAR